MFALAAITLVQALTIAPLPGERTLTQYEYDVKVCEIQADHVVNKTDDRFTDDEKQSIRNYYFDRCMFKAIKQGGQ